MKQMIYLLQAIGASEPENAAYRKAASILDRLKQRDRYFEGHIQRTCSYALNFGRQQALAQNDLRQLFFATLFHDIGKVMIPAQIISKQAPLNPEEHKIIRAHPSLGEKICLDLGPLEEIAALVGCHHERPNGTGYPKGLKENEISALARILAVIEIYDALRSTRSYKVAFSQEKSLEILDQNAALGNLDENIVTEFTTFIEKTAAQPTKLDPRDMDLQSITVDR